MSELYSAQVNHIETVVMAEMAAELNSAAQRLVFLSDFCQFTTSEMKLNTKTFQWHAKMPSIFDEHRSIMQVSKKLVSHNIKPFHHPGKDKRVPKSTEAEEGTIPRGTRWLQQPGGRKDEYRTSTTFKEFEFIF